LDEAQRVENIGITMKLIIDNIPGVQIIATGSSSFELSQSISEPLTGRAVTIHMHPLSRGEITSLYDPIARREVYRRMMIMGSYPEVWNASSEKAAQDHLRTIVDSYLYKDIFAFHRLKKSDMIIKLLQLLALQI
jgi:uncharacterized protein